MKKRVDVTMKTAPRDLTIGAATDRMRTGELTARELVESCLERIHERDNTIRAWVEVYEAQALEEARQCDREVQSGKWRGDLHGIPVGVKDIIDVKGMWTRAGTSIYPARVAEVDAPSVQRLKAAGAIILGKTETTPFANNDPTVTRNPWNPNHTPGGSSSGSGAAVADRMCQAALGTQTGGSLLRPAAYTGIVGFKPTYGHISAEGVMPNTWSFDTVGVHARCVSDAEIVWRHLKEETPLAFARIPVAFHRPARRKPQDPPALGYIRDFFEKETASDVLRNLAAAMEAFKKAGARIVELNLPDDFGLLIEGWSTIKGAELSAYHRPLFRTHGEHFPPKIKARIKKGFSVPAHQYVEAIRRRLLFQKKMSDILSPVDAAIMPVASTTAPEGLSSTGSSVFNRPWTFTGFPAMSIPSGLDPNGLPFAIQMAALPMAEVHLLSVAAWCEQVLAFDHRPIPENGAAE